MCHFVSAISQNSFSNFSQKLQHNTQELFCSDFDRVTVVERVLSFVSKSQVFIENNLKGIELKNLKIFVLSLEVVNYLLWQSTILFNINNCHLTDTKSSITQASIRLFAIKTALNHQNELSSRLSHLVFGYFSVKSYFVSVKMDQLKREVN